MPLLDQDIIAAAKSNPFSREEIITNEHSRVPMSAERGDDIGEVHDDVDPTPVFVDGTGEVLLDGPRRPMEAGAFVVVPAGARHNFINTGDTPFEPCTLYSPPEEAPGTMHRTQAEAAAAQGH